MYKLQPNHPITGESSANVERTTDNAFIPFDPANREGLILAAFLLAVAMAGKVAAGWSYLSSEPTNRLVVGLGMMPRGEVGLIFLGLGSQAGILTPALEAAILLMVIGTTFLAPILLRLVIPPEPAAVTQ